ncbi:MAG: hypothetical protein II295_02795 [Akkermansia sp.]|nr:hypothetical protein [Akkermansia sp.]
MKPQLSVLILLATALTAAADSPTALLADMSQRMETIKQLHLNRMEAEEAIKRFAGDIPAPLPNPDTSMPVPEGAETIAVADGGMLFDADNLRVTYINNVRVVDPRMQVRCSDRLYIQFPKKTAEEGKNSAKSAPTGLNTKKDSKDEPAATPTASTEQPKPAKTTTPICIDTGIASINAVSNLAYLEGKTRKGASIKLTYEQNELILGGSDTSHATMLADSNGDVLITGNAIDFKWVDGQGNPCTLHNETGTAYYKASNHRLYFQGPTSIQTTAGSMQSDRWLALTLDATEDEEKKGSFMPQFSGLVIKGVLGAEADGGVRINRPAVDDKPASSLSGDKLTYNGKTGEVAISGADTTLTYGEQVLRADDSVRIAENGDITLKGDKISGTYFRPAPKKDMAPLAGTFNTSGEIIFTTDSHTITLSDGLSAQDALGTINATGKVELLLQPADKSRVPDREKTGMVNLAIAGHKDIAELKATGGISIKYKTDAQAQGLSLVADDAHLNFLTAETTLTAAAGGKADLQHDDFKLSASSAKSASSLYLAPNGDLTVTGEKIDALLPGKKQPTVVDCANKLTLNRSDNQLTLGPGSRINSENAIITANRELHIKLESGPAEKNKPLMSRYPHLVYNYSGMEQADTAAGGTLQTLKASMQCSGPIHVEMLTAGSNSMGGISKATASGNVAVAGKDTKGRLLRATGDYMTVNGTTGTKTLSGNRVTLQDAYNTHIASGANASIVLDRNNNASIKGAKQSTAATQVKKQVEQNKASNKKK